MSAYFTFESASGLRQILRADGTPITQPRAVPPPRAARATDTGDGWRSLVRRVIAGRPVGTVKAAYLAPGTLPPVDGAEIRSRREALGIGQRALADLARCSRGMLSDIESGRRSGASELAHRIMAALERAETGG